ncbi:Glycoside hydrolase family 18 protein [Ceratobasidium theobromae]|uniref:chitinase n=1 Tax=Ceratobasidium theobromae TaxID=1582974 RepID=A0A5N5QD17_9AGAM|nr:Glycoside hydrolase family 18 protein [Ceratobasidium theobromae]
MEDNGLDGIDIDFEFPTAGAQAKGYVSLLSELRTALNKHAAKKGEKNPYQITAAVPAGSDNYTKLLVSQMDPSLTYWNLMAYDYSGEWSSAADDQANLYGPTTTGFDTNTAIQWYTANGATASKIALGMPIYGRAFQNTDGRGKSYRGVGDGTWDKGVYDYKALPLSGAVVREDSARGSSYTYDSKKREWVSYDSPNIVRQKSKYAMSKGLAGGMFWELAADKAGSQSLVGASAATFGSLDSTPNHLYYPYSKFDNIKKNMGRALVAPGPSAQVSTSTTTAPTTAPSPPTSGGCSGIEAWRSDKTYVGGDVVTYNGHKWTAKWWNQAEAPGASSEVWTDNGAC